MKLIYYSTLSRSCQEVFIRFLNFFRPLFWHLVHFLQASRCFPVASSAPAVFRQPIYHTTSSRVCQELFSWFSMFSDFRLPSFRTALLVYHDSPPMSTLSPDFFPDSPKFMDYFQYFTKSAAFFMKTEFAPLGNFPANLWYNKNRRTPNPWFFMGSGFSCY